MLGSVAVELVDGPVDCFSATHVMPVEVVVVVVVNIYPIYYRFSYKKKV
jgi:hypothetical protein